jgi:hypothetical protein
METKRRIHKKCGNMVVSAIFVAAILTFALAPIASAAGAGNALDFDGGNKYVDVGTVSTDFTGGITIEAYVYYDAFKKWSRIVDFGQGRGDDNILFANDGSTSNLVYEVYVGSGSGGQASASGALELNQWMHLAATEDSSGNVKIYKNGIEVATGTTGVPASVSRANSYIARSNWVDDEYFSGKIDEVRIWDDVRTETEIRENMCQELSGTENGLVAYYKFNEASGTTADNSEGTSALDGTLTNMEDADWVTSTAAIGDKSHYGTGTNNLVGNSDVPVDITWGDTPGANAIFDAIQNDDAPDVTAGLLTHYPSTYWELWIANDDGFDADVKFHYDGIGGIGNEPTHYEGSTTDGAGSITANNLVGFSQFIITSSDPVNPVPELSTLLLFSIGMLMLVGYVVRKRF